MDVAQLLGPPKSIELNWPDIEKADLSKIWASYDPKSDSLLIYLTGRPVPGISHYTGENTWVIYDPKTMDVVGFNLEHWEKKHLPLRPEIKQLWPSLRRTMVPRFDLTKQLEIVLRFIFMLLVQSESENSGHGSTMRPQPV